MTVLVVLEHDQGVMAEASREALTAARPLAQALGSSVDALLVGAEAAPLVAEAARFGAETVHLAEHDLLTDYGSDAVADTAAQLVSAISPAVVLAVGSDRGNEVMAQLAARLDRPFVANCTNVSPGEPWRLTRIQWGGSLLEDATLESPIKLLSFAHHVVAAEPSTPEGAGRVAAFEPDLDDSIRATMVVDRVVLTRGVTLATAPVVVSGGRGVGSAEGFSALEELAELLGGVVGCSRAVTNNGWRPHADQVGQTGTRIAPDIYIATGISGAIQHWVGAMAAKKILAINIDPEANMVVKADYAVIADLHEVVPAISAEIRQRRS